MVSETVRKVFYLLPGEKLRLAKEISNDARDDLKRLKVIVSVILRLSAIVDDFYPIMSLLTGFKKQYKQ